MGVSGVVPRKMAVGFFTTTQKRKIIHGIFSWMIELVERHNSQVAAGEPGNEYFLDETNYKQYIHRLVFMFTNTKSTSNNYIPLTTVLKSLRQVNSDQFDKVLHTFEKSTVVELKRAWGQPVDEPEETVMYEEKVVTVHEVLGDVKVGGITTVGSSPTVTRIPQSPRSRIPVLSPPTSPRGSREFHIGKSSSFTMNVDEDLTMISFPPAPSVGIGSDKENANNAANKADAGKAEPKTVPPIPARLRTRTNSRDEKSKNPNGPLTTLARDLKKSTPPQPVFVNFRLA
jgi:CLIP-associating protein 1/2